jgi:hypothetical protein
MEPKALSPAKINPTKLLGGSSFAIKKISVSNNVGPQKDNLVVIKTQVIEIKNLIKSSTLLKQVELEKKRKQKEKDKSSKKEAELEAKKEEPGAKKVKVPGVPKLGFLERIKNIIFTVLLGRFIVKMLPNLPKLLGVVKAVSTGVEFAADFSVGLINALATFIQKTDEASKQTRGFLRTIGGDNTVKLFDGFNNAINAVIIATIAATQLPSFDEPKKGPSGDITSKGVGQAGSKSAKRTLGRGGAKQVLGFVRPFLKRIPIPVIGALIDFGLSWALGEDPGRAAFKAIGAGLLGSLGAALGGGIGLAGGPLAIAGAAIGALAGGTLGDMAGGSLYDLFFGKKSPSKPKSQGRAEGGSITRGGKFTGGTPKRGVSKTKKRGVTAQPTKLKPGANIGGQKNIEKVFPSPQGKDKGNQVNPLGYIKKSNEKIKNAPFFGALLSLRDKALVGQKPTLLDYSIAAQGLNAWMNMSFGSGVGAFASGGEVNANMFLKGEDLTQVISKSLQDNISKQLEGSIQDLMKQMMLKPIEGEKKENAPSTTPDVGGQYSPEGLQGEIYQYLLSKGMSDTHALGLMANISRESGFRPGVSESGGPGVGLFQYSSAGRKDAFLKAVPDYATNWKAQIDYALREPGEPGQQYLSTKFSSPQEAADWFMRKWERPAEYIQNTEGPRIHREYLASLEKYKTKSGYNIPTGVALGAGAGNLSSAQQLASSMGLQMTSATRAPRFPGDRSLHIQGRAMDFSNDSVGRGTPQQLAFAQKMIAQYGTNLEQLIYTPLGFGISRGKQVPLSHWGESTNKQHYNHVHVAFFSGGPTGKGGIVRTHPGEYIIDKDSVDAFGIDFFDIINQTESVSQRKNSSKQLMSILQFYAGYESGGRQKIKVKVPAPQVSYVPVPVPVGGGMVMSGGSSTDSDYDSTYA